MVLHFSPRLVDEGTVEIILKRRWCLIGCFLTVALGGCLQKFGVFRKHSRKKWMYFVCVCGRDFHSLEDEDLNWKKSPGFIADNYREIVCSLTRPFVDFHIHH